jgi:hypothetical protein
MTSDRLSLATPTATHACVRCGAETALDRGLCENCNPLGLKDSASSQVHGTAFVAVFIAVVVLAVVARLSVNGIGPFPAQLASISSQGDGLAVTIQVTNEGSTAGQTTCRVSDLTRRSSGAAAIVQSPRVEPGATITFSRTVTTFGAQPRDLGVECSAP